MTDSVAIRILSRLLTDRTRADALANDVDEWLRAHEREVGGNAVAWGASKAVDAAIAALEQGASSPLGPEQVQQLVAMPIASRVASALHHLCGMSLEAVAAETDRSVEEVAFLLGVVVPATATTAPAPAPAPIATHTPPPATQPVTAPLTTVPPTVPPTVRHAPATTARPAPVTPAASAPPPPPPPVLAPAGVPVAPPPAPTPVATLASSPPPTASPPPAPPPPPISPPPPVVPGAAPRSPRRPVPSLPPKKEAEHPTGWPYVVPAETHFDAGRWKWGAVAIGVVLALIATGIGISKLRGGPATPTATSSVGSSAIVDRTRQSPGCRTIGGDESIEATMSTLTVQSTVRPYRVYAAEPAAPSSARPLIIDFSDIGQSLEDHLAKSQLDEFAKSISAVEVNAVSQAELPQWNVLGAPNEPDDLEYTKQLITSVSARFCINEDRIVLVGQGAGAHMAAAIACSSPGLADALVMVAGVFRSQTCPGAARLTVISVLGTQDQTFPLAGGTGPSFDVLVPDRAKLWAGASYDPPQADAVLELWASGGQCEAARNKQIGKVVVRVSKCRDGGELWRATLPLDHDWYAEATVLVGKYVKG